MRKFAWYSPELNVIVLQMITEDCEIAFEWGNFDFYEAFRKNHCQEDIMDMALWTPLGEL